MDKNTKKVITDEAKNFTFFSLERGVTTTPKFTENLRNGKPWVQFGAKDNLYPQELLKLYLDSSSLHTSLIRKKANMTASLGFNRVGLDGKTLNFLENRFSEDTLDVVAYKAAIDFYIFGGFYLNITWSKDGQSVSRIQHVPYEKTRVGKEENLYFETKIKTKKFYVSRDWEFYTRNENRPVEWFSYNPLLSKEEPEQILFTKQYSPGAEYYSYCNYTSNLNWVKMAYEIGVFHLKSIQNNMNSGMIIINKNGIPPTELRDQAYRDLKAKYAGADPAGDIIMVFAENKDKAPEFIPMPNNGSDQRFKDLMYQVNENIRLGHDASSIVSNIETAGKLGSRAEIEEAYESFQNTIINGVQKMIEDTFNKLAGFNGISQNLVLNKYNVFNKVKIEGADNKVYESLNTLSPLVSNKVLESMTMNEIRSLVQLPAVDESIASDPNEKLFVQIKKPRIKKIMNND